MSPQKGIFLQQIAFAMVQYIDTRYKSPDEQINKVVQVVKEQQQYQERKHMCIHKVTIRQWFC